MTVWDRRSGRTYLVDCGADFSVYPASIADKKSRTIADKKSRTIADKKSRTTTTPLIAANGSPITTWGTRSFPLLGHGRCFTQEFHVADVTEPILVADFFIANDLAIDLAGRRLIDMANYSSIPTKIACEQPSVSGLHAPSVNAFDRIIDDFPELLIPCFQTTDTNNMV